MRIRTISFGLGITAVLLLAVLLAGIGPNTAGGTGGGGLFGDGSDGPKVYSVNTTDAPKDAVVDSGTASSTALVVSGVGAGFVPGEKILIHQTRGSGTGAWEINEVQSYALGNITTVSPLSNSYNTGVPSAAERAQVYVVPEYTDLTVNGGVTVTAKVWNGSTGGIFAALSSGTATINGTITASEMGYRGGQSVGNNTNAYTGEGTSGASFQCTCGKVGNAGRGDTGFTAASGAGGGGGGNGSNGGQGWAGGGQPGPLGGNTSGSVDLSIATFGGGGAGGSGGNDGTSGTGGRGGGLVFIGANSLVSTGAIEAAGQRGFDATQNDSTSGGGGGAGGSIMIQVDTAALGSSSINAQGGNGGTGGAPPMGSGGTAPGGNGNPNGGGGAGGAGRIRVEYCTKVNDGVAVPPANVAQIACKPAPTPTPTVTPTPTPIPGINITNVYQNPLPKSCFDVLDSGQSALFVICDNDFQGPPATHAACDDGSDTLCNDEDPALGSVSVSLVPALYHVELDSVPQNITADTSTYACSVGPTCSLTFTSSTESRPWFPWDVTGSGGTGSCDGPSDGVVDLLFDILCVINNYNTTKP